MAKKQNDYRAGSALLKKQLAARAGKKVGLPSKKNVKNIAKLGGTLAALTPAGRAVKAGKAIKSASKAKKAATAKAKQEAAYEKTMRETYRAVYKATGGKIPKNYGRS